MQIWDCRHPRATIVIVHGAGEHHRRYQWLGEQWNKQGLNVVTGDLPGQGTTRGKKGHIRSFNQYIDTVEQWGNEANKSGLPLFLFGHSLGGLVVIRTLMERKVSGVQGVILSSPCLGLASPPNFVVDVTTKALNRILPSFLAPSNIKPEHNTRNKEIMEQYRNDPLRVKKVSIRWYQELMKAIKISHKQINKFPNVPLLVMQAGEDYITVKQEARNWFNQLELEEKSYKEWKHFYHEIFNEPEREDVFRYANNFVQQKLSFLT